MTHVMTLAQPVAGANPRSWIDVLRHDVTPVLSAFLVWVGVLVSFARSPRTARRTGSLKTGRAAGSAVASTIVGGYVVFLSIVVVFYFVLGGEAPGFIVQALREGSVLAFGMVVPAFLVMSGIEEVLARRATRRP